MSNNRYKVLVCVYNHNKMLRITTKKEHIQDAYLNRQIKRCVNDLISIILKEDLIYDDKTELYYMKPDTFANKECIYIMPFGKLILNIDYSSLTMMK